MVMRKYSDQRQFRGRRDLFGLQVNVTVCHKGKSGCFMASLFATHAALLLTRGLTHSQGSTTEIMEKRLMACS